MRHLIRTALFLTCASMFSVPVQASGDAGCTPTMKVFHSSFTGCDSMGFLARANDTRINLIYLMADTHKQKLKKLGNNDRHYLPPNDLAPVDWGGLVAALTPEPVAVPEGSTEQTTGEGSICVSDITGSAQFIAAVKSAPDLTDPEKQVLSDARSAINCRHAQVPDAATKQALLAQVQSASGKDFLAYLGAITNFYDVSHFDPTNFITLENATQPWVKEASRYMLARVLVLDAQASAFDDYGTMQKDKVDAAKVSKALDALTSYLKDYPSGAYAASATGLLRRAYWLGGNKSKQLETYSKLVEESEVNSASLEVVNEMDLKLPIEAFTDSSTNPLVLAAQDLRLMREHLDDHSKPVVDLKSEILEAQRQKFASQPELFDYLLATRAWFVDKDIKTVLKLLPQKPIASDLSYLDFSRQLLRNAALDASSDDTVRDAYVAMFPAATSAYQRGTLELALAMFDERHKKVGPDFNAGSLIQDASIRKELLEYVAGPIILRQQATSTSAPKDEQETALFRLLSRDLTQGHFKSFIEDIALLPAKPAAPADTSQGTPQDTFVGFRWEGRKEGYICPDVLGIAKRLDVNPKDIRARMCLGDFFRITGISDAVVSDKDLLGGTGTLFAGAKIYRSDIYNDVMSNKSAPREDRAYALFRAVHCYEPAHSNDCAGKDVPTSVRKGWYDELKQNYGDTVWAKELRYYW